MLGREFKLKDSEIIKTVLKEGRRSRQTNLTLYQLPGPLNHCRGAVVISRKVAGTAVERNRIRRLIFQALRSYFESWASGESSDMVVLVAKKPEDDQVLIKELKACFEA